MPSSVKVIRLPFAIAKSPIWRKHHTLQLTTAALLTVLDLMGCRRAEMEDPYIQTL